LSGKSVVVAVDVLRGVDADTGAVPVTRSSPTSP